MNKPKQVAAILTVYYHWSHADMIVGKALEGHSYDGKSYPDLKIASLYVDQFPKEDMARALAKKLGVPIYPTIADALTLGGKELAVDGALLIGEHGKYPTNSVGQILYPRRRFFAETAAVFTRSRRSVPVFIDKHLSATWDDAKWVYDKARELFVPLLAGSSLPLTWRRPPLEVPKGQKVADVVQIGYGPLEGYGFHALEALQCMVERRKGAETGIKAVRCLQGPAMWEALDRGAWSKECFEVALPLATAHAAGDYRALTSKADDAAVMLLEYIDGPRAAVVMPNGWIYENEGGPFICAFKLEGRDRPAATQFYQQLVDPFGHFSYLLKAFESVLRTGHAPYPVERTLLTTGVLDAVMRSKADKGRRIETPHLAIRYTPTDWPYATDPLPKPVRRP
jgi:hypothetical protein